MIADRPTIFLLTDFGTSDHYVAVMKAVIIARCPEANFIDITHNVAPQAVAQGAYLLESAWPWLPDGSIILAVVDPGVGGGREPVVFYYENKVAIGPNNGLFGFFPREMEGRVLDRPEHWLLTEGNPLSATFHGRDIFASCAAHLASGGHWSQLGDKPATPVAIDEATEQSGTSTRGKIIHFDHFGNAVTTIRKTGLPATTIDYDIELPGKMRCPIVTTYSDVNDGDALAYIGSTGRLEIAVRGGNAQTRLHLELNDTLYLNPGASK